MQIRGAGHKLARLDIGHNHAVVVTERFAAGAARANRYLLPERRRISVEILPCQQAQRGVVCGEHLDARRIGRHQFDRGENRTDKD